MGLTGELSTFSLREVIRSNSEQRPHADALLSPGLQPLTYGQLSRQMDYVGQTLRMRGIAGSDRVAVVLDSGPDMAAAFLGVSAYAVCAPLNPSYHDDEFEFYLKDIDAKAIVLPSNSHSPAWKSATRIGLPVIELEPSRERAGGFTLGEGQTAVGVPDDWGRNEDVALVVHTSGTTSRPKQVPLSHRNLCASSYNHAQSLKLSHDDRCLNVMPMFHTHGLSAVLLPSMSAGASVVCSAGFDHTSFADLMGEFEPTWYSAVPTIHCSILSLAKANPTVAAGGHLRLIRSNSSSLPPTVMAELEEVFRVPVIETYGLSEALAMTANPLPPAQRKPGSVGLPIGTDGFPLRMAIMDNEGQLLAAGETGEIVVRGSSVMKGYANKSEANEAAFADGWFRTGDQGHADNAGYFYVTGRIKEIINRGGEKISPREIDEVLLEHPAVAQAAAFAVPHPSLGEDVSAAVVLHDESNVAEHELRRFAHERLALFKVPSRILTVSSIPKSPTGKFSRIGLHKAFEGQLAADYVKPRTELEAAVVKAIQEVLETSPIGVIDNFFELGGDSLKAARVLARLSSRYSTEIPAVSLFLNPNAQELALEITRLLGQQAGMLEQLITEIESMSNEEARRQLEP